MTIRQFLLADLKEVMEIERICLPHQISSKSYFEKFHQEYPKGFIVLEENNKILGYAVGTLKESEAKLICLAVKPEFQKKGLGTNLIEHLISFFKEKGVKKISLNVRTSNKRAVAFHQKLGFKIIKEIKGFYRNGDDAYLMEKGIHPVK